MYAINNIPITAWGLRCAAVGGTVRGYLLSGQWSLPKRLGETYHDWEGNLEPYVDAGDIHLAGRDLTLELACTPGTAQELRERMDNFKFALPDFFTLSHEVLGSFNVGTQSLDVKTYGRHWAALTLKLKEPSPALGGTLPAKDNGAHGIDGYSWAQLGFVVKAIDGRHDTPGWSTLSVTSDPRSEAWLPGYRQPRTITIEGTLKGASYADFKIKIGRLQTLLSSAGMRAIRYFDGSQYNAFCVDGFTVSDVLVFGNQEHWGTFNCKMIVV